MTLIKMCCACILALVLAISPVLAEQSFESLCEDAGLNNADVQAWLEIPGTNISYPVLQHSQDDSYYLDHNARGVLDNYGALFTESVYNAFDFSDPVTVIYGHRMNNGSMFGTLQKYYSGSFDDYRSIYLYMPDGQVRQYTAFAAVIQDDAHILNSNNFYSPRVFNRYFDNVYATRKLGIVLDHEMRPAPDDQVIILSTCIKGDASQRYLVMAKLELDTKS